MRRPPPPLLDAKLSGSPLEIWKLIRRTLAYMRPYAALRNTLIVLACTRASLLLAVMWVFTLVLNGPVARQDPGGIFWGTLAFAAVALASQIIMGFRVYTALRLGESVARDMRMQLYTHLQRMTARFYHKAEVGSLISRMTSDIEQVRIGVQDVCFISLVNLLQMGLGLALMAWTDRVLFCLVILIAPILFFTNRVFRKKMGAAQRRLLESYSRVSAAVSETVDGVRVTQGFVRREVNNEAFQELLADHTHNLLQASRANATFLPILESTMHLFVVLLLVLGGYRVFYCDVPYTVVVQFLFMAGLVLEPVRVLAMQYNQAFASLAGAERLFRVLDEPPDWEDAPDATDLPPLQGRVEFRDVSFGYEPGVHVLHHIDLVAEPGQTIALVGHTGSGKSSMINLLTKAYLPTSGGIFFDGREIRTIRSESLRRQLGIVPQRSFLFSGTVMENIRFSCPSATDEEILQAARELDFLDLIEAMPNGFQTTVGEGGNGLSVGQRQVVCFLRAWLAQPRILVLDEATSAIDAITEARLQRALEKLLCGRTSFVVAHRLSTIMRADQILVLDHGRIVERGTHTELLERRGVYYQLHRQFMENTSALH